MTEETNAAAEAQKKAKPLTFASMYSLRSINEPEKFQQLFVNKSRLTDLKQLSQKICYANFYFSCTTIDLTALAQALDSQNAHTSIGKLPLSVEKSAPQFSFTQANRWDGSKIFVNELTKQENIGKNAPGPQYMYEDKIKYSEVSEQ